MNREDSFYGSFEDCLAVDEILTIHAFDYACNRSFVGESHPFWEVMFVDKGMLQVETEQGTQLVKSGSVLFLAPMVFHKAQAVGTALSSLVVLSFRCQSQIIYRFQQKPMLLSNRQKELLSSMIHESQRASYYGSRDLYGSNLARNETPPFAGKQILQLLLEYLLILLVRDSISGNENENENETRTVRESKDQLLVKEIKIYLGTKVRERVNLDTICRDLFLSRTYIQNLFKHETDNSLMDYYKRLKIEAAKEIIEDNHMNFTELSDYLGYSSIYHFSRKFKETTGLTPSEYAQMTRKNKV